MNISTGKRILPFLLMLLLIPTFSWASCFSPKIIELTKTTEEIKAKVLANKKLDARRCQLTLSIDGLKLSGEAKRPLCDAKINDTVSVRIRAVCCDTQPCPKGQKNKLLFSAWRSNTPGVLSFMSTLGSAKTEGVQQSLPQKLESLNLGEVAEKLGKLGKLGSD